MCKSKAEGGQRCNSRVARMVCTARTVMQEREAAGDPVDLPPPPPDRGIVHPEQARIFADRWPGDEVETVIRRNVVTDQGVVVQFDPARHKVKGTHTVVSGQERAEAARAGVVLAVNKRTGEYVTYEAREANGVWRLGDQVDAGDRVAARPVIPEGFSTRLRG